MIWNEMRQKKSPLNAANIAAAFSLEETVTDRGKGVSDG